MVFVGVGGGGGPVRHPQLGVDVLNVAGDGVRADDQVRGDLAIGLAGGQVGEHLGGVRCSGTVESTSGDSNLRGGAAVARPACAAIDRVWLQPSPLILRAVTTKTFVAPLPTRAAKATPGTPGKLTPATSNGQASLTVEQ